MDGDLWKTYCSFLDKDFNEQLLWNEKYLLEYFKDWKNTKMAKQLCPNKLESFEDIPVTTYSDYPIMHEFDMRLNELTEKIPREKKEQYCDYYDKLSRQIIDMCDGWMADDYSFCAKTSGTTGESKWFIHGKTFLNNFTRVVKALLVISCSSEKGMTSFREGDSLFAIAATAPYYSGYILRILQNEGIKIIPPIEVVDEEPDFMKKIRMALKYVKKSGKIDIIGSTGSMFKLTTQYFTNKAELFCESYKTAQPGIMKAMLWFIWKYEKIFGKKICKLKNVMHPKGILLTSFDTELYLDYTEEQLEIEPLSVYGATEIGAVLYGRPGRRSAMYPDLQTGFYEFLDENENLHKLNDLVKGGIYELVFTPYRSIIMRYRTGDLFRVIGFQKDGLPVFCFESRVVNMLDIYNYFRFSLSLAFRLFNRAGFPPSNNWAFTKGVEPREHLILLMEKELDLTESEVSAKIFEAFKAEDESFGRYIADFKITNPEDVIKVQYLKRGAFRRFVEKKVKQGVPFGRIKPFRIITPKYKEISDFLRSA